MIELRERQHKKKCRNEINSVSKSKNWSDEKTSSCFTSAPHNSISFRDADADADGINICSSEPEIHRSHTETRVLIYLFSSSENPIYIPHESKKKKEEKFVKQQYLSARQAKSDRRKIVIKMLVAPERRDLEIKRIKKKKKEEEEDEKQKAKEIKLKMRETSFYFRMAEL